MSVNRRRVLVGSLSAALAATTRSRSVRADPMPDPRRVSVGPVETIELWPGEVPGTPVNPPTETLIERSTDPTLSDRALTGITRPRMVVFTPAESNGAAVLILPGGAYQRVVIDKEGYELGRWLAARGLTAFVLYYRLPGDGWAAGPDVALSDAQRAMRLIRHNAQRLQVDQERIAVLGFSAGGHLCADLSTRFAALSYEPVDTADSLSAQPRVAAPIYPVISMSAPIAHAGSRERLIGKDAGPELERRHSPQHNVSKDTPPCFLVHAEDDTSVPVGNTLEFRHALRSKGVPVETHLFTHGGHGFGLRNVAGKPASIWPELFLNWSRSTGLL